MRLSHSAVAISFCLLGLAGARAVEPVNPPATGASVAKQTQKADEARVNSPQSDERVQNLSKFHARLLELAGGYASFGRVDDEYRWAPWLCKMPWPSVPRFSGSDEEATHGRKLYFLFAKDRNAYMRLLVEASDAAEAQASREENKSKDSGPKEVHKPKEEPRPSVAVGQAIVKESWKPKEVDEKTAKSLAGNRSGTIVTPIQGAVGSKEAGKVVGREGVRPYAEREGKVYHAAEKAALFIMFKLDPSTPDTDQGWVYGTVTADGKQVTSAGKVASCMACHREAAHDRLFGLQTAGPAPILPPQAKPTKAAQ